MLVHCLYIFIIVLVLTILIFKTSRFWVYSEGDIDMKRLHSKREKYHYTACDCLYNSKFNLHLSLWPFLGMVSTSLKTPREVFKIPPSFIPQSPSGVIIRMH